MSAAQRQTAARATGRTGDEIAEWLEAPDTPHTLGALVALFGDRAFAVLFIVLLAVPALPLPTGGVTHVFELVAVLIAAELVVGRDRVWLPRRLRDRPLEVDARSTRALVRLLRRLDRLSRPTWASVFSHRISKVVFGLWIVLAAAAAFLAPPFSGLDTIPACGGVILSAGVLAQDVRLAVAGIALIAVGATIVVLVGVAAIGELRRIV